MTRSAVIEDLVRRTTRSSGVPEKVTDPTAIARVAAILASAETNTPAAGSAVP